MPFVNLFLSWLRKEYKILVRFGIVGFSSLGVKIGLYALLSRLLWTSGPRAVENVMAMAISIVYNYTFHRIWTFKHQGAGSESFWRYGLVVIFGSSLDATLFWVGHDLLKLYDFFVLFTESIMVACCTYFTHKYFTFKGKRTHEEATG